MSSPNHELDSAPARIGVTCGTQVQATAFGEQPTVSLNMCYLRAVARAGGLPMPLVPSGADPTELVAALDGLVLTGGGDLDPDSYGEEAAHQVYGVDRERDDFEFALLCAAEAQNLPILAICRGLQLVNVSRGGTLIQHVDDHELHWQTSPPHEGAHTVSIDPGSGLAGRVGADDLVVNSYHHQAIGRLGAGLAVVAETEGLVEAFETPDGLITAVQWHPEQMFEHHPRQLALFTTFARHATQQRHSSPPETRRWSSTHV
jgi:putative glutamine amidotransferase